jgi:hypothetical protein
MIENDRVDISIFLGELIGCVGFAALSIHDANQIHHDRHGQPRQTFRQEKRKPGQTQALPEAPLHVVSH